ncbi:BRCT domain-containing protein Brc1 [Schizosaccharomyces cryophilus OY26]|uniref:BRCT domain-containing protein Brc1 n=1 Tax=Schizosaccharomyces cryophilus (strain OY26 / ATCC MYA-4695 / CBS 11777 / NBRC 106824 / NRRL Y48691) TaxID=653667 RepID=S9VT84_SCHCR|nr:BRCT domain-containing protein Brc1 [Schizosaccharomyces cryophilus OY26]EPY51088.1 BRCT domain-containing protein Brc1 [Schizosaccharomyces cryophilus OY26]
MNELLLDGSLTEWFLQKKLFLQYGGNILNYPYDWKLATHVIGNNFGSPVIQEGARRSLRLVKTHWIEDCIEKNALLDYMPYSSNPYLIYKGICATTCEIDPFLASFIDDSLEVLGGKFTPVLIKSITHVFSFDGDGPKCKKVKEKQNLDVKIIHPRWIFDCLIQGKCIDQKYYLFPNPVFQQKPEDNIDNNLFRNVFHNKKVFFSGDLNLPTAAKQAIRKFTVKLGAGIAESVQNCDVFIGFQRETNEFKLAVEKKSTIATINWLLNSFVLGSWKDPLLDALHFPLPSKKFLKGQTIALTNYTGKARTYLEKLIVASGASYTKNLKPTNSALIAASSYGQKYGAAKVWNISSVHHTWLFSSFKNLSSQPYSDFPVPLDESYMDFLLPCKLDTKIYTEVKVANDLPHDNNEDLVNQSGTETTLISEMSKDLEERLFEREKEGLQKETDDKPEERNSCNKDSSLPLANPLISKDVQLDDDLPSINGPIMAGSPSDNNKASIHNIQTNNEEDISRPFLNNITTDLPQEYKEVDVNQAPTNKSTISSTQNQKEPASTPLLTPAVIIPPLKGFSNSEEESQVFSRHSSPPISQIPDLMHIEETDGNVPSTQERSRSKRKSASMALSMLQNVVMPDVVAFEREKRLKKHVDSTVPEKQANQNIPNTNLKERRYVVITGYETKPSSDDLKKINITIISNPSKCTHLVAPRILRTAKFLCAIPKGPQVVTMEWLQDSIKHRHPSLESEYLLKDEEKEKEIGCSLQESLQRAREKGPTLLKDYVIYLTSKTVAPENVSAVMNIVKSNAGACSTINSFNKRLIKHLENGNIIIITCQEDRHIWENIRSSIESYPNTFLQNYDWLMRTILRQELNVSEKVASEFS